MRGENKKNESIYEEARRTVTELNEAMYKGVKNTDPQPEREFVYTEGSYACGISFGEITLWDSENDDRVFYDAKNEYGPLREGIVGKVAELAKQLTKIAKGIK